MCEQMQMLALMLIRRDPEQRVGIYEKTRKEALQSDQMGHGPNDFFTIANE